MTREGSGRDEPQSRVGGPGCGCPPVRVNRRRLLTAVRPGERVRLVEMHGGHGLRGHLAAMGLVPDTEFEVLQGSPAGPYVVLVRGSRVVLGHGMVERIEVE